MSSVIGKGFTAAFNLDTLQQQLKDYEPNTESKSTVSNLYADIIFTSLETTDEDSENSSEFSNLQRKDWKAILFKLSHTFSTKHLKDQDQYLTVKNFADEVFNFKSELEISTLAIAKSQVLNVKMDAVECLRAFILKVQDYLAIINKKQDEPEELLWDIQKNYKIFFGTQEFLKLINEHSEADDTIDSIIKYCSEICGKNRTQYYRAEGLRNEFFSAKQDLLKQLKDLETTVEQNYSIMNSITFKSPDLAISYFIDKWFIDKTLNNEPKLISTNFPNVILIPKTKVESAKNMIIEQIRDAFNVIVKNQKLDSSEEALQSLTFKGGVNDFDYIIEQSTLLYNHDVIFNDSVMDMIQKYLVVLKKTESDIRHEIKSTKQQESNGELTDRLLVKRYNDCHVNEKDRIDKLLESIKENRKNLIIGSHIQKVLSANLSVQEITAQAKSVNQTLPKIRLFAQSMVFYKSLECLDKASLEKIEKLTENSKLIYKQSTMIQMKLEVILEQLNIIPGQINNALVDLHNLVKFPKEIPILERSFRCFSTINLEAIKNYWGYDQSQDGSEYV